VTRTGLAFVEDQLESRKDQVTVVMWHRVKSRRNEMFAECVSDCFGVSQVYTHVVRGALPQGLG
jgi:hypothetical protein